MTNRLLFIFSLSLMLLLSACGGQNGNSNSAPPPPEQNTASSQEPAPEAPPPVALPSDEAPPAEESVPEESPAPQQPELLLSLLSEGGLTPEELDTRQLIVAKAVGNEAEFYVFSADENGLWRQDMEPISGHVGKNGVTAEKAEGDKKTPLGLYALPFAFGMEADPGCALEYRAITEESYWVDDSASVFYNQWVEGSENKDWASAEHLCDYPSQYAYGLVVAYNMEPPVPGAGSAIFLHCGDGYTAGCLSVPTEAMREILLWVREKPAILILGE